MTILHLPILDETINKLMVGEQLLISGDIFCGRDAVLPKIVNLLDNNNLDIKKKIKGSLIFHTAVSVAGIGPTSSNKLEIESSIIPLSHYGIKITLGKGKISKETVEGLNSSNSIYCVVPPVTALLNNCIMEKELIAFPDLGMEAFYKIKVKDLPAIVAVAHGKSIYEE